MIKLNESESKITALVVQESLGIAIAPESILGLEVHSVENVNTVVVVTKTCLHAIGKDYFRSLVAKYKAAATSLDQSVASVPVQVAPAPVARAKKEVPSMRDSLKPYTALEMHTSALQMERRGTIPTKDGSFQPDPAFYGMVGRVSQIRGSSLRPTVSGRF